MVRDVENDRDAGDATVPAATFAEVECFFAWIDKGRIAEIIGKQDSTLPIQCADLVVVITDAGHVQCDGEIPGAVVIGLPMKEVHSALVEIFRQVDRDLVTFVGVELRVANAG